VAARCCRACRWARDRREWSKSDAWYPRCGRRWVDSGLSAFERKATLGSPTAACRSRPSAVLHLRPIKVRFQTRSRHSRWDQRIGGSAPIPAVQAPSSPSQKRTWPLDPHQPRWAGGVEEWHRPALHPAPDQARSQQGACGRSDHRPSPRLSARVDDLGSDHRNSGNKPTKRAEAAPAQPAPGQGLRPETAGDLPQPGAGAGVHPLGRTAATPLGDGYSPRPATSRLPELGRWMRPRREAT
jgi:hypothetical protein